MNGKTRTHKIIFSGPPALRWMSSERFWLIQKVYVHHLNTNCRFKARIAYKWKCFHGSREFNPRFRYCEISYISFSGRNEHATPKRIYHTELTVTNYLSWNETVCLCGLNKNFSLKFWKGYPVRHSPEEGQGYKPEALWLSQFLRCNYKCLCIW